MLKIANGRFVGMTDHNRLAVFPRGCNRLLERAVDCVEGYDVVQEHIPSCRRYQVGFGDIQRDSGRCRAAVQEIQISLFDDGHQTLHRRWRTGQQTTGVIAHSCEVRQAIECGFKGSIEFRGTH